MGGIVRDNLLDDGGHFTDFDLTTDATPEQSEQILRGWGEHTWDIGKEYGTISARKNGVVYEVTTYRAEVYVSDSRKPTVEFGTDLSADLVRRDFTINAMAAALPVVRSLTCLAALRICVRVFCVLRARRRSLFLRIRCV